MAYTDFINEDEEITLDTVEPYVPPQPEAFTSQFTPTAAPEATPYTPPTVYTPKEETTAEGRMSGLLSSGSPYLAAARARGIDFAGQRGLLNTSMAAGAAEKSAIEAAFPIASQDAKSFHEAGMTGYQGEITGALAGQK